jgi:release factor glutamine methyltransferase
VPGAVVHAADVDPAAVAVARRNLPGARVTTGDLFDALAGSLRGAVHVLAANAPYVPTGAIATMPPEARLFEDAVALDGGADGLDVQRRILADAPAWLAPGGAVLIETSERQAAACADAFCAAGLMDVWVVRDDERDATVVAGRRPT